MRTRLAALALIAGILAATGGPAFSQARHPVCAASQHDCDKTATIASCCCGDRGASATETTPAHPRIEIQAGLSAAPLVPHIVAVASATTPLMAIETSPPRRCLLDLPTLFGALLI